MIGTTIYSLIFLLLCHVGAGACYVLQSEDESKPLFLTPYINRGEVEKGRELAKVESLTENNVESYSGYFTVDDKNGKNLFFWYFPAETSATAVHIEAGRMETECSTSLDSLACMTAGINVNIDVSNGAPVVLWLQGGPGSSSMFGLLEENGPYQLMNNGSLRLRDKRWSKNFHLLYIDSPVGTGFSFARAGVYDTNEAQVSKDLYEALTQFFKLFPNLDHEEFFIAGESYAGRYVPALGLRIHKENPTASKKINLAGLLIGDGMVDNEFMIYGDYLAQHGLIDLLDLPEWQKEEEAYKKALSKMDYQAASSSQSKIFDGIDATGVSIYNFLETPGPDFHRLQNFFNSSVVRQKIHVGNTTFSSDNTTVNTILWKGDFFMKVSTYTEALLEDYRVMHYNGQLDIICHYPMAEQYTKNLQWSRSSEFQDAPKQEWFVGEQEDLAGYVKKGGNLYLVMVRDAGHMVPKDQPEWAFDLVTKFVSNTL